MDRASPVTWLQLLGARHPIHEWSEPGPVDRKDEPQEALLRGCVLEAAGIDGVVAGVAVQLLHGIACFIVAAPDVARLLTGVPKPVVQHGEVDVERLRGRAAGLRLQELGVRRKPVRRLVADEVGGVDDGLSVEPAHALGSVRDGAAGNREQHHVGVRDVATAAAESCHVMTSLLPAVGEATTDVSLSYYRNPHHISSLSSARRMTAVVSGTSQPMTVLLATYAKLVMLSAVAALAAWWHVPRGRKK